MRVKPVLVQSYQLQKKNQTAPHSHNFHPHQQQPQGLQKHGGKVFKGAPLTANQQEQAAMTTQNETRETNLPLDVMKLVNKSYDQTNQRQPVYSQYQFSQYARLNTEQPLVWIYDQRKDLVKKQQKVRVSDGGQNVLPTDLKGNQKYHEMLEKQNDQDSDTVIETILTSDQKTSSEYHKIKKPRSSTSNPRDCEVPRMNSCTSNDNLQAKVNSHKHQSPETGLKTEYAPKRSDSQRQLIYQQQKPCPALQMPTKNSATCLRKLPTGKEELTPSQLNHFAQQGLQSLQNRFKEAPEGHSDLEKEKLVKEYLYQVEQIIQSVKQQPYLKQRCESNRTDQGHQQQTFTDARQDDFGLSRQQHFTQHSNSYVSKLRHSQTTLQPSSTSASSSTQPPRQQTLEALTNSAHKSSCANRSQRKMVQTKKNSKIVVLMTDNPKTYLHNLQQCSGQRKSSARLQSGRQVRLLSASNQQKCQCQCQQANKDKKNPNVTNAPELQQLFQSSITQIKVQSKLELPLNSMLQNNPASESYQLNQVDQRMFSTYNHQRGSVLNKMSAVASDTELSSKQRLLKRQPSLPHRQSIKRKKQSQPEPQQPIAPKREPPVPPEQLYHNKLYTQEKLRSLKWFTNQQQPAQPQAVKLDGYGNEQGECPEGGIGTSVTGGKFIKTYNSEIDRDVIEISNKRREIYEKYNQYSKEYQKDISNKGYKYILYKGNNSNLIQRVMQARSSWVYVPQHNMTSLFEFKWSQFSGHVKFDQLGKHGQKSLANHFEFHGAITQKDQLYQNISKLCEANHKDVSDVLPITFVIDFTNRCVMELAFEKFQACFNTIEKFKSHDTQYINQMLQTQSNQQSKQIPGKKPQMLRDSMFSGQNLWVLKPNDCNRGRGVQIFNKLDDIKKIIMENAIGLEAIPFAKFPVSTQSSDTTACSNEIAQPQQQPQQPRFVKSDQFIIQKYIEKPLLIKDRKFDIRLWVLVTQEHECFLFEEAYIRMSSYKYTLAEEEIENLAIHLTNNAIQKLDQAYGSQEDGNQLSLQQASELAGIDFKKIIKNDVQPIIELSLCSARQKLNKNNRKFCFEIFGYDFMIDVNLQPWLIEVNTNPCLEESSALLKQLIPRMIDDAFKLTLDQVFPPLKGDSLPDRDNIQSAPQSSDFDQACSAAASSSDDKFPVKGYPDDQNLWGERFYKFRAPA